MGIYRDNGKEQQHGNWAQGPYTGLLLKNLNKVTIMGIYSNLNGSPNIVT